MAISRKSQIMKERLIQERDELIRRREAIENQILGIERAISLIGRQESGDLDSEPLKTGTRANTKMIVLDLLKEAGTTGLNAQTAVALAEKRGVNLDRASVSSLLSRLKRDEIVTYDNERYRLKEFSRRPLGVVATSDGRFHAA